ncbi:MAG: DUF359 domain-containing protein [Methanomicrobiales archaeon]|nr:DUF359 domain-containing protein [Methanomicrobiales archaeon]
MLRLPPGNRDRFREPFGDLYPDLARARSRIAGKTVYTVGDVVTANLLREGMAPTVAIIDGQTMRLPCRHTPILDAPRIRVANPAGTITDALVDAIHTALADPPALIQVEGEEDLAVIPLVDAAPEGGVVLYGQPGEGVVVRDIDADAKTIAKEMLLLFERI